MTLLGKYEEVVGHSVGLRRGGVESGGGRKMKGDMRCWKKRGREQKYKAMKELREKPEEVI